ncbi:GID complex subunit 4, VID24 [Coemansia sp. RSA 1285]|nr:GID complex subunit 4, VID24 [Coemansia sp. RSA 1285]
MPVITHRRVNEMRGGRRRLSVGAFSTYTTGPGSGTGSGVGSGTSPRSGSFSFSRYTSPRSPSASKEFVEHKPTSLECRSSVRPAAMLFDSSLEGVPDESVLSSSGLSSEPASPQLQSFMQSGRRRGLRPASPAEMPLVDLDVGNAADQRRQIASYGPDMAGDAAAAAAANSECADYEHNAAPATPESPTPTPTSLPTRLEALGADSDGRADSALETTDTEMADSGVHTPAQTPPSQQHLGCGYDVLYAMDTDSELDGCSDEDDMRNEPLPTPEQLILSQSWSTWPTPCHHLYSGSRFSGSQSNGTRSYVVTVDLKYVDMGVPELCGHFTIRGLTNELPRLTTYFDAQIIGTAGHSFITNQWDATVDTDRTHWSFFPAFRQHRSSFDCSDFAYKLGLSDRYVFMRWKERFVVPNYKLNRINGASYDGFYYVCYDREEESITGYYYHRDSDHYQCLKLNHVAQTSFSHFELA